MTFTLEFRQPSYNIATSDKLAQHQQIENNDHNNINMRFTFTFILLALFAALCLAAAPQKQVIISYPKDTPAYVLDEAKDAIIKAVSSQITSQRNTGKVS